MGDAKLQKAGPQVGSVDIEALDELVEAYSIEAPAPWMDDYLAMAARRQADWRRINEGAFKARAAA